MAKESIYTLRSEFSPTGDQPAAIAALVAGVERGERMQTLLGVTGSGKTFTMANVIARANRPTIILEPNKTLAAQLCSEMRAFFPDAAVEYFVSYYDYYQPEAYIPGKDMYIEKDALINDEIDRLRHSATSALFERRDVIIVASVSCIYSLGDPSEYKDLVIPLRPGMIMSQIVLADEINRASPKTQSALLEAMEEGKVTVDGNTMEIPDPFMVIATQNPAGYVGTYPLPEAQLDRFALKLSMGYPSPSEELNIIKARKGENPIKNVKSVLTRDELRAIREMVTTVHIDDELYQYIVTLITATRKHPALALGASPRASVALVHLAQAYAFLRGRDYVLPDDIAGLFRAAIAHRLMLRQEAKLAHQTTQDVLTEILRTTEVPYKGKRA